MYNTLVALGVMVIFIGKLYPVKINKPQKEYKIQLSHYSEYNQAFALLPYLRYM